MLLFTKQMYSPSACREIPKPFAVVSTTSFLDSLLEKSRLFASSLFWLSPNTDSATVQGNKFILKVQIHIAIDATDAIKGTDTQGPLWLPRSGTRFAGIHCTSPLNSPVDWQVTLNSRPASTVYWSFSLGGNISTAGRIPRRMTQKLCHAL